MHTRQTNLVSLTRFVLSTQGVLYHLVKGCLVSEKRSPGLNGEDDDEPVLVATYDMSSGPGYNSSQDLRDIY